METCPENFYNIHAKCGDFKCRAARIWQKSPRISGEDGKTGGRYAASLRRPFCGGLMLPDGYFWQKPRRFRYLSAREIEKIADGCYIYQLSTTWTGFRCVTKGEIDFQLHRRSLKWQFRKERPRECSVVSARLRTVMRVSRRPIAPIAPLRWSRIASAPLAGIMTASRCCP